MLTSTTRSVTVRISSAIVHGITVRLQSRVLIRRIDLPSDLDEHRLYKRRGGGGDENNRCPNRSRRRVRRDEQFHRSLTFAYLSHPHSLS